MAIPRKYRKRRLYTRIGIAAAVTLVLVVGLVIAIPLLETQVENGARTDESGVELPDYVERDLLVPNEYSRPGDALTKVNGIVIHYVGNPGSTAKNNRDYFNNLALTKATYASSHFSVGLDGEVIQCVPLNE
ncbi:MAG: N-acetylmuramoyl-L-alanine amidase, partial [Clostridia bacterium]|nr:N-acetylmuramoyl-L-alanine amidase [Clostridia bacterium]